MTKEVIEKCKRHASGAMTYASIKGKKRRSQGPIEIANLDKP